MKCYLVTFETSHTGEARLPLEQSIKSFGTWGKITENSWAVVTGKSAKQVRDQLLPFLAEGDRIIVMRSGIETAWSNALAEVSWLKQNLVK